MRPKIGTCLYLGTTPTLGLIARIHIEEMYFTTVLNIETTTDEQVFSKFDLPLLTTTDKLNIN